MKSILLISLLTGLSLQSSLTGISTSKSIRPVEVTAAEDAKISYAASADDDEDDDEEMIVKPSKKRKFASFFLDSESDEEFASNPSSPKEKNCALKVDSHTEVHPEVNPDSGSEGDAQESKEAKRYRERSEISQAVLEKMNADTGQNWKRFVFWKTKVTNWPHSVPFTTAGYWTQRHLAEMKAATPSITFELIPGAKKSTVKPDLEQIVALYKSLNATMCAKGLLTEAGALDWERLAREVEGFPISGPNYRSWSQQDTEVITAAIAKLNESEKLSTSSPTEPSHERRNFRQRRFDVRKALSDKYYRQFGVSTARIPFSELEVVNWPRDVPFMKNCVWKHSDMDALEEAMPRIQFKRKPLIADEDYEGRNQEESFALHRRLVKELQKIGYATESGMISWKRLAAEVEGFPMYCPQPEYWGRRDCQIVQSIIDVFVPRKLKARK